MSRPDNTPNALFRLEKMYLKDLSFENPNAPAVFRQATEPKVEVNLSLKNRKVDGDRWEVALTITVTVNSGDTSLFIVEAEHAGVFLLENIPEKHLPVVLAVDCPTLLFPFTRQIVCQAVLDGGFMPFLMEPVNFLALYQSAKKQKEAAEAPKH